ncbi:hypothetical protein [Streptobacillus moniliformis]|uniref:hypothetical protein n=1 Tax=Streptobacillus moniliformis TaxID=34105 RepID=UPI0007EEE4C2|nr:hypothetical protein [Streptobacillus moniliformis]
MKKILITLISLSIFSFSANITGPRYRLEGSVGAMNYKGNVFSLKTISTSISVLPEWKAEINKKVDITFGPKVTLNVTTGIDTSGTTVHSHIILGGEIDLNYRLKEDIKLYSGIELGIALGGKINDAEKKLVIETIQNVLLGIKIKERYNVGIYMGNGKGMLGIEAGYTF